MNKLLLVDDDKEVLSINAKYFKNLDYEVEYAVNAKGAVKKLESFTPDCIVLDVMMPGIDGFKTCEHIRKTCDSPIIFLTGKDSEDDKIQGLLIGGDDYMVKPYSLRELEVRIQVLIRRYKALTESTTNKSNIIEYPFLTVDLTRHKVFYKKNNIEEDLRITNKEFDFLCLLAASPNRVFTFEEIGNAVWGNYIDSDKKTIMVTASRLRKKLDEYPVLSKYIESVWSKGYKFVAR